MSFFTHHSRHSWPPYETTAKQTRTRKDVKSEERSIDENPFSYFISAPLDDRDERQQDYFSAGIDDRPAQRPLLPFRRKQVDESNVTDAPKSPSTVLRRWIRYMEIHHPSIYHSRQDEGTRSKPVVPFIPPTNVPTERGREPDRSAETTRGRRQVRSHSGRPRSWREPSADLWPVSEGCEGVEETLPNGFGDVHRLDKPPARERRVRFVGEV